MTLKGIIMSNSSQIASCDFREVEIKDCKDLAILMGHLGYPIDQQNMMINLQKYLLKEDQKAWVAVKNDQVVGCIAIAITDYFHRPGSFLRIITLVTNENCRGEGIGKSLIQIAEKYAQEKKCCHVELTSGIHRAEAHCFYKAQNYTELNPTKKYFAKKIDLISN